MENRYQLKPDSLLQGRYKIVMLVGEGILGNTYLAHDIRQNDSPRTVKEYYCNFADEAERKRGNERFENQTQLLAELEHPSIPAIYDNFLTEDYFYLVMDPIAGRSLADKLRLSPDRYINERTVVNWTIQICDVLDYLHSMQPPIIFRCLKPETIAVDEKNHIKLADFAVGQTFESTQKMMSSGAVMGYTAPEIMEE
jgi:eukaryotic-like serine/threonine-protein kinase